MKNKKYSFWNSIQTLLMIVMLLLFLPTGMYLLYGKFTYSIEKAREHKMTTSFNELIGRCEFGAVSYGGRPAECEPAPCKTYNIDGKECVREGYSGKGFLGLTDFDNIYYVCEGYGRMARYCIEHFDSMEEFIDYHGFGD